jgi:class 3 adenylate cyclase
MSDIPGDPKAPRKLAAILAADIAGYSALMGADEAATVRDLKGHQGVILPIIGDYGGRVIDTAGDGTHPLGDVVSGLIAAGLQLDWLHEHDCVPWQMFGCLVKD